MRKNMFFIFLIVYFFISYKDMFFLVEYAK